MKRKHEAKEEELPEQNRSGGEGAQQESEDIVDEVTAQEVPVPDQGLGGEQSAAAEPDLDDMAKLEADLDEVREQLLRTAADFDNFRKRTARERAELWGRAQSALVGRLLEPLDDLRRVLESDADEGAEGVVEGVRMVERKLLKELGELGLEQIGESGEPFDPNLHEAVGTVPAETEDDDGTVVDVFQLGYRFGDSLLRPARVRVAVTGDGD